ncbi:MAG: hypothetical protein SFZ24_00795 [Planctomycetota bacterium]|nr:hypothetical protein [Planctomycetota bacterium]
MDQARRGELPRVIARLRSGWAVLGPSQLLEGYALLLPDPVVGDLTDLKGSDRGRFLDDMASLGDAVSAVCRPRRLNFAMLGNVEPALHAHVIPRYAHEPVPLRDKPIWSYAREVWDAPEHAFDAQRHAGLMARLRAALREADGAAAGGPG